MPLPILIAVYIMAFTLLGACLSLFIMEVRETIEFFHKRKEEKYWKEKWTKHE